jgi:hypothetical protein
MFPDLNERLPMPVKQVRSDVLIPFVREKTRHITVVGSLRGKPARLIVDKGAGATCIDSNLLKNTAYSYPHFRVRVVALAQQPCE